MTCKFNDSVYVLCYEGEGEGGVAAPPKEPPKPEGGQPGTNDRRFTQEEVNKILAEDKRKHQEKYQQLEGSYQELLQNQNLTTEQRDDLKSKLEEVQKSLRTKEQQAEYERKQAEEKYKNELESQKTRADHWENLFKQKEIERSLQDAASFGDAYNSRQIVGLLKPFTTLKEDEGGTLTPMVDFPDIDEKTGEEITTLRTPTDAVKRMRELPKIWGNLFKSNVVSGVGSGQASTGDPDSFDYSNMSAEEYRKHRAAIKARLGRQ
jgi:hypothetical protein